MDESQFTNPAGRLASATTPDGQQFKAFVPDPLPPADEAEAIARNCDLLEEANHALGRLDGVGLLLPNPDHLVRPYMRREAVLSSRIEGTQTSFGELVAVEADPRLASADAREVLNYVHALDYGLRHVHDHGITSDLVRDLHRNLMSGARGEAFSTPGEYRAIQNHIGTTGNPSGARFVPPPPEDARSSLELLFAYLAAPPARSSVLVQAAWLHYQFETIHPFLDGNGRVGRLLVPLLLAWRRRLEHPLLYLSPYFERRRDRYYDLLFQVSAEGAWEAWLQFFLGGVRDQAEQAVTLAQDIVSLGHDWRRRLDVAKAPHNAHRAAELFQQHVAMIPKWIELELGVSSQTAYNAIAVLERVAIVEPFLPGVRRGQLYRAAELVELMERAGTS